MNNNVAARMLATRSSGGNGTSAPNRKRGTGWGSASSHLARPAAPMASLPLMCAGTPWPATSRNNSLPLVDRNDMTTTQPRDRLPQRRMMGHSHGKK